MSNDGSVWHQGEPFEKLQALLRESLEEMGDTNLVMDETDRAIPPWAAFPDYGRRSLGWRMGGGEEYRTEFFDWYRALSSADRTAYRSAYPAPAEWSDYYELIEPEN